MDAKFAKFLGDSNYVHCSICRDFGNVNAFSHRRSKNHKKRLISKLRKIAFHLAQKKKKVVVHDEGWPERDSTRFCHFCADNYEVHLKDGEFVIEDLGALYHHASSHHVKCVENFLLINFSKENYKKFCIMDDEIESTLKEVAEAKTKYLKKMSLLNDMIVQQIKTTEEERKKLVADELQIQQPSCSTSEEQNIAHEAEIRREDFNSQNMPDSKKMKTEDKVPPWLEDVANTSVVDSGNVSTAPVIGPTLDTLMKHVENQKKKGLPPNRVGANFQQAIRTTTKLAKWHPAYHGTWNRRRRKENQQRKFTPRY